MKLPTRAPGAFPFRILPFLAFPLFFPGVAALTFEDGQEAAGILHPNADPEGFIGAVSSGVCWGDLDGDGLADALFMSQEHTIEGWNEIFEPTARAFFNNGDGTFREDTVRVGLKHTMFGTGCSLADYDDDGDLDILQTAYGEIHLFENDGAGFFADVTAASGITVEDKCPDDIPCWGTSSAWADYDHDGDLDVYVTNYVDWDIDVGGPVDPGPYDGQPNLLWRNNADGTFTDVTAESNTDNDPNFNHAKDFQAVWFDHDRDGWLDLYVAADGSPNALLRNNQDGTFTDVAVETGTDNPLSSMGLDIADEGRDGIDDLYFTHYALQHNGFYEGTPSGAYIDRSGEGELDADWLFVGWGTGFHDFDNDGDIDLYAVNGVTGGTEDVNSQRALLWMHKDGEAGYEDVSEDSGPSWTVRRSARGSAVADYDNDGDLDILTNHAFNQSARLFQNLGPTDHWVQLELRQAAPNTHAVGSYVVGTLPDGTKTWRSLRAGNSFMSQDWDTIHFGLGDHATIDLEIHWAGGEVQTFEDVAADQRVRAVRGSPLLEDDTLTPQTALLFDGPEGDNGWFLGPVDVDLRAHDLGVSRVSGVAGQEGRLDGGPWTSTGQVRVAADGIHTVEGRARDAAGNLEPARRAFVMVDSLPPVSTVQFDGLAGTGGWFRGPVSVAADAADATSGVDRIEVRLDGGAWCSTQSPSLCEPNGPFTITEEGEHVVEVRAVDVAGNMEPVQTFDVRIDSEKPVLQAAPGASLTGVAGAVVAAVHDATSGAARVEFFVDEEPSPRHVDTSGERVVVWDPSGEALSAGLHALKIVAWDAAGNAASVELVLVAGPSAGGPEAAPPPLDLLSLGLLGTLALRRRDD